MQRLHRWMVLGVVGVLLSGLIAPAIASAQTVCFKPQESSFCLTDPFSAYWQTNGGLPVFGFPITTVNREVNRDTGKTYRTQWLERNRLEFHPLNTGTPYEVLLGLLGKDRLLQLGRNPAAEGREAGPQAGCLWFEQTGHNVCNQQSGVGFKTYWESNGLKIPGLDNYARSLQLFGLPLTAPKMERNSSGDTVLTQWFERARFEWHPKNPQQFRVLLGLLGTEVRGASTPIQPTPRPVPPVATSCKANGPAPADGGQAWVLYPRVARNAEQVICARLLKGGEAQHGFGVTALIRYPNSSISYTGIIDSEGIAAIPLKAASVPAGTTVQVDLSFSSGERAQTSFIVQ